MSAKIRGGYDVTEVMWVQETGGFGQKPASGTWLHFGDNILFDAQRRPLYKQRIGLGRQYASELILHKEYAELALEVDLLDKSVVGGAEYEWVEPYAFLWGEDAAAATIDLEKHMSSLSVGAKLDLATDEFATLIGCKFQSVGVRARMEENAKLMISMLSQKLTENTTDYVDTGSRKTFPSVSPIRFGDCDFFYDGSSILDRLQGFEFVFRRDLERRGSVSGSEELYSKFAEVGLMMEVSVTLDFDTTTEMGHFMGDTTKNIIIKMPNESGGREINLPTCQWKEGRKPQREVDLIDLTLTAEVLGVPTITTTA